LKQKLKRKKRRIEKEYFKLKIHTKWQ